MKKRRPNRAQRRKTAVEEAIAATSAHADAFGFTRGHREGRAAATMEIATEFLQTFDTIAQGSVELRMTRSPREQLGILFRLLKDWVRPYSNAHAHAKNASMRRGAVIAPHQNFPLPLTIEVAIHNTDPDVQVVTAMMHRAAGEPTRAVMMLNSLLPPLLTSGFTTGGLMRRSELARGDEPDMLPEVFEQVLHTLFKELSAEYCRVNVGQFNQLVRRRKR